MSAWRTCGWTSPSFAEPAGDALSPGGPGTGRRIRVIGTSGAGKTHVARELAAQLDLAHLELDALQHLSDWQPSSLEQFKSALESFLAQSDDRGGWVIDGNYSDRAAELFEAADTIVWLDYSRLVVMSRLLRRTVARILFRRELWNGNRESVRTLFSRDPDENVVLWAWTSYASIRGRYLAAMEQDRDKRWVRLRTPAQARTWLRTHR